MTITNAKPALWEAGILRGLPKAYRWADLMRDVSSEFSSVGYGDKLNLNKITSGVTVRDYEVDTDISAPERMTDAGEVLNIDQQKYFNIAVDDVDSAQSKPALLSYFAEQAADAMAEVSDTFLRDTFEADVPAGQQEGLKLATYGSVASSAVSGNDLRSLVIAFNTQVEAMEAARWPVDQSFVVINTKVASMLRLANIRLDAGIGGTGARADRTFTDGTITNMLGVRTIVDPGMDVATPAAGDVVANFGLVEGCVWARQITSVEPYRLEKQFSDGVKGLQVYGAKKVLADRQRQLVYEA